MDANNKPKSVKPWGRLFWMIGSLLAWSILGLMFVAPVLGRTGPTRQMECKLTQNGIEWLASAVSKWEQEHPGQRLDVEDIQQGCSQGTYARHEDEAFAEKMDPQATPRPEGSWGGVWVGHILQSHDTRVRREDQGQQAGIVTTFRYSRGPDDPIFELRSWDRKPMEDYMAFAKRKEITKIVVAILPWVLLYAVGVGVIVMVSRVRK